MVWVQILVQLAIAVVLTLASLLLAPKPAKRQPSELEDFKTPTSKEDDPVPVVFGTVWMRAPNVLSSAEKHIHSFHI